MKHWIIIVFTVLIASTGYAQSTEFTNKFNEGILYLGNNKLAQASVFFEDLYQQDSTNANISYLLGQCYARRNVKLPEAIRLLKKSILGYSPEYKKRNASERNASEYAYYYLLMAYSAYGECSLTLETLNDFYRNYSYDNEWYLVDAQRIYHQCVQREVPVVEKEIELVTDNKTDKDAPNNAYVPNKRHIIGTKQVSYTDKTAAWGVQVGAFLEPVFTYEFIGLRNVEVYVDNNGIYRYVVGRFAFESQADKLLDLIYEEGYKDAFITNVKDMKRFSEEVITIDNESIHKKIVGRVDYRIQVGAFIGDTIPDNLMEIYLQLDSLSEVPQGELTIITVGSFNTFNEADFYRELVQDIGLKDAFVTSWNYQRKVDLRQAEIYLKEQAILREELENQKSKEAEKNNKKKKR